MKHRAFLVTTEYHLTKEQYREALLKFLGIQVEPSSVFTLNKETSNEFYTVKLQEKDEQHAQRIWDEQRGRDIEARAVEFNDMRHEVLRLFEEAIKRQLVDSKWLEDARRIINQFK